MHKLMSLAGIKSLDHLKPMPGSSFGASKSNVISSRSLSDSVSSGSFGNLKLAAEKMIKEQASSKADLDFANAKLKKLTEDIHSLEEKLQNAFNENVKLKVKHKEDEKVWKGLESKFISTKALCDQLTETFQLLVGQVQDAENSKVFLEDKISLSSAAFDALQDQLMSLSVKLESSKEAIQIYEQRLTVLRKEKEDIEKSFREEQLRDAKLLEEKVTVARNLEASLAIYRSDTEILNAKMEELDLGLRLKEDDIKHLRISEENLQKEKDDLLDSERNFSCKLDKAFQEIKNLKDFLEVLAAGLGELDQHSLNFSVKLMQLISLYDSCFKLFRNEMDLTAQFAERQYDLLLEKSQHVQAEKEVLLLTNGELINKVVELQKVQELVMVQHAEECRLAEEKVLKLECEAKTLISKGAEMELLVTKSEEKIANLSESSKSHENKMQYLLSRISTLETENQSNTEKMLTDLQNKVEEVDHLQVEMEKHEQQIDSMQKEVINLQYVMEEKEKLLLKHEDKEKELEDIKEEIKASLVDTESKLSEAKKQYDLMLESKQLELSRHLKELSQKNDQAINDIRGKFEAAELQKVNVEKEKAEKAIREVERKCEQKLEEIKEESRLYLMRTQEEHAAMITHIQHEHEEKKSSIQSRHSEELKLVQIQAANELREKITLLRNEHEVQIKALNSQNEDQCRQLQEELEIQRSKEDRQRALLQLQWKVMGNKPQEEQEVNSRKNYKISSSKIVSSGGGRRNQHDHFPVENEAKDSPYSHGAQTPVSTLMKKVEKGNSAMGMPKHSRKVTRHEYEVETANGTTITKRRKTRSTVMFGEPRKHSRRTPKAGLPKEVHKEAKVGNPHPSNIGDLFTEGSLNPYADDPYAFD
ncbi:synaptonemal complex protein 2-like [Impatiens glandulifera]|uniref:synaptonemal complex protein 2-like n=1 Tax=Impatiens glandulifera TaxID=253017 RepID=UPI001FB1680E|nr:synaptonemal complex protein 2-like [Impatiens glandulifera]XP_047329450.1 synaptonemal complex protein 2-like [Impatiens glandulifera]